MNQNLAQIIGIELLTASQGVEMRAPLKTSDALQKIVQKLRESVPALKEDRFIASDLEQAGSAISNGCLVDSHQSASIQLTS